MVTVSRKAKCSLYEFQFHTEGNNVLSRKVSTEQGAASRFQERKGYMRFAVIPADRWVQAGDE